MPQGKIRIRFDEGDLAHIIHHVYWEMFQHENMMKILSEFDLQKVQKISNPPYHRGCFALFLLFVKGMVEVD